MTSMQEKTDLKNRSSSNWKDILKRAVFFLFGVILAFPFCLILLYVVISLRSNRSILPIQKLSRQVDCIIVPGAQVIDNVRPSLLLRDRLDCAIALYEAGISDRILVSGDHRVDNYNEPAVMCAYLIENGIPDEAIFMDHYGLDTYDTMLRARDVFQIKTAVVTTQQYHLQRALYIAGKLGLECEGYATVKRYSARTLLHVLREMGARVKAFYETNTNAPSTHTSPVRPISGDGRATRDKW
jgi:SanA protein